MSAIEELRRKLATQDDVVAASGRLKRTYFRMQNGKKVEVNPGGDAKKMSAGLGQGRDMGRYLGGPGNNPEGLLGRQDMKTVSRAVLERLARDPSHPQHAEAKRRLGQHHEGLPVTFVPGPTVSPYAAKHDNGEVSWHDSRDEAEDEILRRRRKKSK